MKNNIRIKTLTPVHIGSGALLQNNTDYIVGKENKDSVIYVIDPDRIGKLIADDKYKLQQWLTSIDRGDTRSFFENCLPGIKPSDYAKRTITNFVEAKYRRTLKECLHDGFGRPYIPGTSLKGAIRTAIVSFIADRISEKEKVQLVNELKKEGYAEGYMLGKDPNGSLMRFIRVGDAYYKRGMEIAITQVSINQRGYEELYDDSKYQAVEAIGEDEVTSFSLAIDEKYYDCVYSKRNDGLRNKGPKYGK